jgi:Recombination endonuclease VII
MPGQTKANKKDARLRRVYGITLRQWQAMWKMQKGCCAICGKPFGKKRAYTDHDHKTGRVRGILCYVDNRRLIGRRSAAWLYRRAAEYLEREVALGLQ